MRRRTQTIRDAHASEGAGLPTSRGVRTVLAALLILACASAAFGQSGVITTVVGPSLRDSSLTSPSLQLPTGVAVSGTSSAPVIYTADAYNCVVWQTQGGQSTVFAGILATTPGQCSGGTPTAVPTTTTLEYPVSVALCNGNLFIASNGFDPFVFNSSGDVGGTVDEVDSTGTLTALPLPGASAGGPLHPVSVACDASENVYVASYFYIQDGGFGAQVNQFSPKTGGGWTVGEPVSGLFDQAYSSIAVNPISGDLYGILDAAVGEGWLGTPVLSVGSIENITQGTSGLSGGNNFYNPDALAFDSGGNIYISEAAGIDQYSSYVEQVQADGTQTIVAGTGNPGYSGDGGLGTAADVYGVDALAFDSSGDLYMADSENQRIRSIHPLTAGPSGLTLASLDVPQSSGSQLGSLQGVLNPVTGDFYYVAGANSVNVINTGSNSICPACERIVASIVVGAAGTPGTASPVTLAVDSTRNLVYASNTVDGTLYVIDGATHSVVGSLALSNNYASLLAIDTGLNEIYAAGPSTATVIAIQGGTSPELIGSKPTALAEPISSISVDAATHVVYAVGEGSQGYGGYLESLFTLVPDPTTGVLSLSTVQFPEDETIEQPNFIANSLAVDPETGSLIASGAASIDTYYNQTYSVYDIFQLSPSIVTAPVPYLWPPITTSLDVPNRAFYITDFDGNINDPSSHATMVTGIDGVAEGTISLTSTTIPVFGTGTAPTLPHVYSIAPDTSSYQAWVSASDANSGGFVELWDSTTQTVAATLPIPNSGGGPLFINSANHSGYLLDEVNGVLWLINSPPWTNTPPPTFTPAHNGQSVTISATNAGDAVFYTLNGTPPGLGSTACNASCAVNLAQGVFTTINAIEVANVSGTQYASNVAQGVFTAPAPTSLALTLAPSPATTGATITATATLSVASDITSVTGTVTFTAVLNSSTSTLCSAVAVQNNAGSWQAACPFTEATVGSYTITAAFSGDPLNQASSNDAVLQINQGTTPILAEVGGASSAIAINSNNTPGLTYNAVLNNDSSVSLVQNGFLLLNQGCPAYSALSSATLSAGAIYVDAANSRIYLAMLSGGTLFATYESISRSTCTQGPLLTLSTIANSDVALSVDPVQGNVYVMNYYGANFDLLYIVSAAPWNPSSLPTAASVNLDYSTQYGPMEIDPSNHQVYINDLGGSAYGSAGAYATAGFFVYDPNHSATPANNLQHVVGYSSGGTITQFNVGTLLDNNAGKLILINENPNFATANLTVPITILDTTKFSFFTNTSEPNTYNNDVDITLGAGLSTISATAQYSALGGADINTAAGLVYAYAFNANATTQPGMLLEYNLSPTASPQETVLSSSMAMPTLYDSLGPWNVLNYNPASTEIVFSANSVGSGALGFSSPLCAGNLTLTQIIGNIGSPSPLDYPVVNDPSGYVYAVQPASFGYPPAPAALDYIAPPPSTCGTAPPLQISPATLPSGIVSGAYSQLLAASGGSGSGYQFSVSSGTALSAVGLTLSASGAISGTPALAETAAPVTVQVTDSQSNTATQAYQLTIYPALSITTATLPNGIVGGAYSQTLAATGGSNSGYTWSISSGEASLTDLGLTLSAAGKLTGPPTFAGSASFTLQVVDSVGNTATANYHFTIYPLLTISPATLPAGIVNTSYSQPLSAVGGSGSGYQFSVVSGNAFSAVGLVLSPGGAISGSPRTSETSASVTVQVRDGQGDTGTITYLLTIYPALSITTATLPNGIVNGAYSQLLSATGGSETGFSWSVTAGASSLSALNFSLSSAGKITGTPGQAGTATFTAEVTDSQGNTASMTYQITVYPLLTMSPTTLPAGIVNSSYSQPLSAVGGSGSGYQFSVVSGNAFSAVGLVLSPGGAISGTPRTSETAASVTVQVRDGQGDTGTRTYLLTIDPVLAIGPATLPNGLTGTPYSATLTATGGSETSYSWSVPAGAGSLSALSLSLSSSGQITGTPEQAGTATFTVEVTDSQGHTASMGYQINVISSTPANVMDMETISVSDGPPQVAVIDVNDPNESITVDDMYQVSAITPATLHLTGPATTRPGQSVTFTATVTANVGTVTPTGSINFTATGGLAQSVPLGSNGSATWTTTALPPGTDTVTAVYPGATGFAAAGPMTLAIRVLDAPTITTLIASAPNEPQGHPVTFTAVVTSPASGTPTGTITFFSGTINLGAVPLTGDTASLTTSALPPGINSITAVYSGDPDFLGSSSTALAELTTTFKLSFESNGIVHLFPGQSVTLIMTVSSVYGDYPYPINVNVAGLPQGATAVFSAASVIPGSSTVTATLTITLPSLGVAQTTPAWRMRDAVPALLALLLPLTALYRRRRQWRSFLVVAMAAIALASATGLSGCGSGGFFNQAPKTYNLTVSGTSGTATQSTTLTLTVE